MLRPPLVRPKENIAALRKRLEAVRKRGKEYFDEADPEKVVETAWPFDDSWEIKDAETLQKCEALRQAIKELSVEASAAPRGFRRCWRTRTCRSFGTTRGRC